MEEGGAKDSSVNIAEPKASDDKTDIMEIVNKSVQDSTEKENTVGLSTDIKPNDEKIEISAKKNPEDNNTNRDKLCGWLIVTSSRGIRNLKTNRQRWFQFGEENCKLYCYK